MEPPAVNPSQRAIRVLDVFIAQGRRQRVLAVITVSASELSELSDFWYFDPASSSIWSLANIAHVSQSIPASVVIQLVQVSGTGTLVAGLELHMVPIGWQP